MLDQQRKSRDSDSHSSSGSTWHSREWHCCSLPVGSASVRKHSPRNTDGEGTVPGVFQPCQHSAHWGHPMPFCREVSRPHLQTTECGGLQEPGHLPKLLLARRGNDKAQDIKKTWQKCSAPSVMAGRQSLPLSGAPESAAPSRAPFRIAGWKLLLPLFAFCLELQSFLNCSLSLLQGFCRCPIFVIESAHQLPWERISIKTAVFPGKKNE